MKNIQICFLVLIIVIKFWSVISVVDKTAENLLINLANYAIESRQINHPCFSQGNRLSYSSCIQKLYSNRYGLSHYPSNYLYNYNKNYYIKRPYPSQQNQNNVMDVLASIAQNDELRCVPRLLCEVVSDTVSKGRQGVGLENLPFNLNLESIVGLLSGIDIVNRSPFTSFGKAALLGYISKGSTDSCWSAYPDCPRDPDKLVQYLNNHKGGFFKFFSGTNFQKRDNVDFKKRTTTSSYPNPAESRIQNKPYEYIKNPKVNDNFNFYHKSQKKLTFPKDDEESYNEFTFRKPKELPFSIQHYTNALNLQKPLPNHEATPMIFPDRTGTGDLRLDPEELNGNYKQFYNLHNTKDISFSVPTNEGFYYDDDIEYGAPEGVTYNSDIKTSVSFPR